MTPTEALQQHQQVCDDLYALALEENSHLQQHRQAPGAGFADRKRALIVRLEEVLVALRAAPAGALGDSNHRLALDATRGRVLQILQLERENEQLLLRASLPRLAPPPTIPPSVLRHIYQRP
jgi:hypothetical protein